MKERHHSNTLELCAEMDIDIRKGINLIMSKQQGLIEFLSSELVKISFCIMRVILGSVLMTLLLKSINKAV